MSDKGTIKAQFEADDKDRHEYMERVRRLAVYTDRRVLPDESTDGVNDPLMQSYQSVGSRGTDLLVGRLLTTLFPLNAPWFQLEPSPLGRVLLESSPDRNAFSTVVRDLKMRQRLITEQLKATDLLVREREHINNLVVSGSSLAQMRDDYRLKVFRLDQWVNRRDGAGDVMYLITKERVDPLTFDDRQLAKVGLTEKELAEKRGPERLEDIYTMAAWQPRSKTWVITQEILDKEITQREEAVSPYMPALFKRCPGDDYGRGLAEMNEGDLRSFNGVSKSALDLISQAGRVLMVNDPRSGLTNYELQHATQGAILNGKVDEAGRVSGVGFIQTQKERDMAMVQAVAGQIEGRLSKAYMMESELMPTGDRVTAFAVSRVARELEGGLGGIYSGMSEEIQRPLFDRTHHQMIAQGKHGLQPLPEGTTSVSVLTGAQALTSEAELQSLLGATQTLVSLKLPRATDRLNEDGLIDAVYSKSGVDPTDILRTPEEADELAERRQQDQLDAAANTKAIDVAGNLAEQTVAA